MDLLAARNLQALSLGFHIILVCFGVAFPIFVLTMEGLYLRTRDDLYRRIARRWTKAMAILFAVGVVSGTVLSFELGILWPEFMAKYGDVFGFAFALEGTSLRLRLGPPVRAHAFSLGSAHSHRRVLRLTLCDLGERVDEQPRGV